MADFDSLNNLTSVSEEEVEAEIRKYFEEMEIKDSDKEKRISLAIDIEKGFRNLFILMLGAELLGNDLSADRDKYSDFAYRRYQDAMNENGYSDDTEYQAYGYIEQYAKSRSKEIVDTAILNRVDNYYFSLEHSIAIAEDETNAVANYHNEMMAISSGMKYKTWITMRDKKVRHSHELLDGKTISIFKPFSVGGYQAMFPMDASMGLPMKERANCRCIVEYSGRK